MERENLALQRREHQAWIEWAKLMREIGLDLNSVDVATFEPARVALTRWALAYAAGYEAGAFDLGNE